MQHWRVHIIEHPTLGPWVRRVEGRPGWVWKLTVAAAVLTIVLPLILLTLAAVLVAAAVFTVLSLVAAGLGVVRAGVNRLFGRGPTWPAAPSDDGRRNVRVIDERW